MRCVFGFGAALGASGRNAACGATERGGAEAQRASPRAQPYGSMPLPPHLPRIIARRG